MTDSELRATAAAWLAAGLPAMEVEVLSHRGSVPREAGTRMLVAADAVIGTIGGGHLELKAIERARALLHGGAGGVDDRHYPLGPALGQCCGGALTLRTQRLSMQTVARWPGAEPLFTLQLYGAGHVGRAIVRALAGIDCRVQWIDERESEFPAPGSGTLPAHVETVCVEPVEAEVAVAPPGAFYLVLTHSHDLDLRITEAVLKRGDFGFLGLIGSQTKRARFIHRFEARGIATATIERMTCPIGVPGIGGKQPAVIALAVAAQLLQVAEARHHAPSHEEAHGRSEASSPPRGAGRAQPGPGGAHDEAHGRSEASSPPRGASRAQPGAGGAQTVAASSS